MIKRLSHSWKRGGFIRDTLTLVTGTAMAQVVSLAFSPVLSRIYSAEDFGVFALYNFIVAVPAVFVCWCYEPAILLPKDNEEAAQVLSLSLLLAGVMSVLALLPAIYSKGIAAYFNVPALAPFLWCVSLNLFTLGVTQALNYWLNRNRDFSSVAVSRLLQSTSMGGAQIALSTTAFRSGSLIAGQVLGQVVSAGYLGAQAYRKGFRRIGKHLRHPVLLKTLSRFKRFPLYSSWGTAFNVASFQIVPAFLTRLFTPADAGHYFFGYRLVSAAVILGSTSLGQVLYQRAARERHEGKSIDTLVEKILFRMLALTLVPFLLFILISPDLFALLFGNQWRTSGHFMRLVGPMFYIQFIVSPLSMVLFALEKQHIAAVIQFLMFVGTVCSLSLGFFLALSPTRLLIIYSAVQSLVYLVYLKLILRESGASWLKMLRGGLMNQAAPSA